jgi:hypothetical protein
MIKDLFLINGIILSLFFIAHKNYLLRRYSTNDSYRGFKKSNEVEQFRSDLLKVDKILVIPSGCTLLIIWIYAMRINIFKK